MKNRIKSNFYFGFEGMLTKQHPDIALSIKTRQAIRSVLNQLRDGIHELLTDGILEEAEGNKIEKVREYSLNKITLPPTRMQSS